MCLLVVSYPNSPMFNLFLNTAERKAIIIVILFNIIILSHTLQGGITPQQYYQHVPPSGFPAGATQPYPTTTYMYTQQQGIVQGQYDAGARFDGNSQQRVPVSRSLYIDCRDITMCCHSLFIDR